VTAPDARGAPTLGTRVAYRPEEAAAAVGVGRTTIFEEIRAGRLRARKVGRATIIADADLREWVAQLQERRSKRAP
jgi:excisionase family DNA binding protein